MMIEIKFWFDDAEAIRDFGILLLQNCYIYHITKKDGFCIFHLWNEGKVNVTCKDTLSEKTYAEYTLSIGDKPEIEFKAFSLKIY